MKLLCENKKMFDVFTHENSLLDSIIEKIEIYQVDTVVNIKIWFRMRPSSDYKHVMLHFIDCKEYSFYYSDEYTFYNVELLKFFNTESGLYYVAFDPDDEIEKISIKDQDIILASKILAYDLSDSKNLIV